MSSTATIAYEVSDRVARATLDRPARGNALTSTLIWRLDLQGVTS